MDNRRSLIKRNITIGLIIIFVGIATAVIGISSSPSKGELIIDKYGFYINTPFAITSSQHVGSNYLISVEGKVGYSSTSGDSAELNNVKVYLTLSTDNGEQVDVVLATDYVSSLKASTLKKDNIVFDKDYTKIVKLKYSHEKISGLVEAQNIAYDSNYEANPNQKIFGFAGIGIVFLGMFFIMIMNTVAEFKTKSSNDGTNDLQEGQTSDSRNKTNSAGTNCKYCGKRITINTDRCPHCKAKLD